MENQPKKLGKMAKFFIIAGFLIVALSVSYYFINKKTEFQSCYSQCQKNLSENSGLYCVKLCSPQK